MGDIARESINAVEHQHRRLGFHMLSNRDKSMHINMRPPVERNKTACCFQIIQQRNNAFFGVVNVSVAALGKLVANECQAVN